MESDATTRGRILRKVVNSKLATEQDLSDALDAMSLRESEEGLGGRIVNAGDVANDIQLSPKASDELKARAAAARDEIFAVEGEPTVSPEPAKTTTPKAIAADASPTKPFGSTPDGTVRAPEPDERVTSNRKAFTHKEREQLGLNKLNSPEREAIRTALDEAKAKNMDADADMLAEKVLAGGERRLTRPEAASMGIRKMQLLTQFDAAVERLKDLTDPLEINAQAREMDVIRNRFDKLSEALVMGNSEAGRDLNFAKMTLDKDLNLLPVLARAKAKKGKPLTPESEAKFKELTEKLKESEARVVEAEKRTKEVEAREAITTQKRISRAARKPREQLKAEIADLTEETRRLFRAGCLTS